VTLLFSGVLVDVLLALLVPAEGRPRCLPRLRRAGAAGHVERLPAVASVWVGHLPAVVEYWTGIPLVTALLGLVLAVLMQPTGSAGYPDRAAVINES
jgi:hypothetical protein